MKHKISLERAVYFTKLSVRLACTWPPPRHATKWEILKEDILWSLSVLSALCLIFPLLLSIYEYRSNSTILTQSACFVGSGSNLVIKTLICRIHRKKSQILIHEMEEFLTNIQPHEKRVLQQYVDKCWMFHAVVTLMNYLGTATLVLGPVIFPQPLPTLAVYPFSVDSGIALYLVYTHQIIAGFQGSAGVTIDCQVALMMWFASARLESLAVEINDSSSIEEFRYFVEKHQRLLSYAAQVSGTMCYIALTSTCICGIGTIMSCMQLVGFATVALIALINLLICAWPAENLISVCDMMGTAAYNTPWTDMSPDVMKYVLMILRRSQKPVLVSVGGFLPSLSLHFYASFLSGAFSYFTTLRIAIMDDDN